MNHWSDCSCLRWLVALVALVPVMACVPDPPQPDPAITTGIPTPLRPSSMSASPTVTVRPSASATPSSEELVRQTQAAYQIAFDEYHLLAFQGGAADPSARLKSVMSERYLEMTMSLLRDQMRQRYVVKGPRPTTRSRSVPGYVSNGSDGRLTIQVCEDRVGITVIHRDGRTEASSRAQGYVYAKLVGGRPLLVDVATESVDQCEW